MEQFWRNTGIQLGKHWKVVVAVMVVITGVLVLGATRIEFATGQDSYLNPDSQIALDNVAFQDDFGGETIILLFSAEDGSDVSDLFVGDNLEKLKAMTAEVEQVDGVFSVVTPYTSMIYSSALVGGPTGTQALTSAVGRDEAGAEARNADIGISLARRGAVGCAVRMEHRQPGVERGPDLRQQRLHGGRRRRAGRSARRPTRDPQVAARHVPERRGWPAQRHRRRWHRAGRQRHARRADRVDRGGRRDPREPRVPVRGIRTDDHRFADLPQGDQRLPPRAGCSRSELQRSSSWRSSSR